MDLKKLKAIFVDLNAVARILTRITKTVDGLAKDAVKKAPAKKAAVKKAAKKAVCKIKGGKKCCKK